MAKTAVLVGAGHAHLHTIKHAGSFTARGFALVLIAPGDFWYSGLATGMLGGRQDTTRFSDGARRAVMAGIVAAANLEA